MTNEEILENAPDENLTHFDGNYYWQFTNDNAWCRYCNPIAKVVVGEPSSGMRSISDIRRIVELQKRLAEVERELEDANANLVEWNDLTLESQGVVGYHLNGDIAEWDEFEFTTASPLVAAEDWKNKFTIEQQIKALEEALHTVANQYNGTDSTEWAIGANHVLRLFVKHTSRLRQQLNGGE